MQKDPMPDYWADEVFPRLPDSAKTIAAQLLEEGKIQSPAVAEQLRSRLGL